MTTPTTKVYSATPDDFKDTMGRWRTNSLFKETNTDESKYTSVFTLADEDTDGRISMRRIYMDANDPTEFLAAKQLFGNLECWTNLCKSSFFKPHLTKWRAELQRRIQSRAVRVVEEAAKFGKINATQLNAAKWLATQEWEDNKIVTNKRPPGRPPKVTDPSELLREGLRSDKETEEDLDRIS